MLDGPELLAMSKAMAPYFRSFFGKDMMVAVTDRERILAYAPGEKINGPCDVGALIPSGEPMLEAMASGKGSTVNVPKEVYGFPFKSTMTPIFDNAGQVIGCICVGTSMEVEDEVKKMSALLLTSLGQVSAAIQEIASSAAEVADSGRRLVELVRKMGEATDQINQVLTFIRAAADQTKMLGLNAAIEAARAGTAGLGFSVVAEEIRKLSDESKQTVGEVHKLTGEINGDVKNTMEASQKTLRATEEQAAATQEISASVQELTNLAIRLEDIASKL
jgi:methyl-accepting chemotaxis protein